VAIGVYGTNTEIALLPNEKIDFSLAHPARLLKARTSDGWAGTGAIEAVRITDGADQTIGDAPPGGCGSGIVDAIARCIDG
jgi:hypothetical protein